METITEEVLKVVEKRKLAETFIVVALVIGIAVGVLLASVSSPRSPYRSTT